MWYLLIPLTIFAVDIGVKYWIEQQETGFTKEILGGHIILRKSHNRGALMNIMEKRQKMVAIFSTGLTFCILIAYLYLLSRKGMQLLKAGVSFLIGGACSNVFDRLKHKYVVDYFSFRIKSKKLQKIVFNLADMFIFLGSFLVIFWNCKRKS